jgi:Fe2+ or Zn2+ uptake regulation protein
MNNQLISIKIIIEHLDKLKKYELIILCKYLKIKGYSTKDKKDLIALLEDNNQNPEINNIVNEIRIFNINISTNYNELKIYELLTLCKHFNISNYSTLNKDELIEKLQKHNQN